MLLPDNCVFTCLSHRTAAQRCSFPRCLCEDYFWFELQSARACVTGVTEADLKNAGVRCVAKLRIPQCVGDHTASVKVVQMCN